MDSRMEGEREAEMGERLTKAMHINDVTPCVEIGRFDAQLFHTKKIRLAMLRDLGAAAAQRPGSRQVPFLKHLPQPPPPTLPLFSFFFM